MKTFYDRQKKRLIYSGKKPSPKFWDTHWDKTEADVAGIVETTRTFATLITQRYLKPGDGIILEGGCGRGQNVAALVNQGYKCIGIDWAEKTVALLNRYAAELDIRQGDVRKLPFPDNYFAGYWSVGVIEHFRDGYEPIALEMTRVIKDNGYLFLAFPYMSPLRKFKAAMGIFSENKTDEVEYFYQFALDKKEVINHFESLGFTLVRSIPFSSIKGLKDEIVFLKPLMQKLYDYKGHNRLINLFKSYLSIGVAPVACHSVLLVLRKNA